MFNNTRIISVAIASVVVAATAPPAEAQLETVIVTAQKREESLQTVPMAISNFSADSLQSIGITSTADLQVAVPGLVFSRTGPAAQPFLRGIGTRIAQNGLESSVAVYTDNRYEMLTQAMLLELADIERVEVLKGPQGTLYGRNATAGAVRIITNPVAKDFQAEAGAGMGNYGAWHVSGMVNLPANDQFGIRLSGYSKKRDGFSDNLIPGVGGEADSLDMQVLRGKARWEVNDVFTANLTIGYTRRDDSPALDQVDISPPGGSTGIARGGINGDRSHFASLIPPRFSLHQGSGELNLEFDLGALDLSSISTYTKTRTYTNIDADGTSARAGDSILNPTSVRAWSQEFQLQSATDSLNWILGAFYYRSEHTTDGLFDVGAPTLFSTGNQRTDARAYALYGQATWAFAEKWDLTVGGRWSNEKKDVRIRPSPLTTGGVFAMTPFDDSEDWSDFSPKVSLQRHFDAGMVYLTYSRGFKSGGYSYPARSPAGVGDALDPETLDMVELGIKSDFLDGTLRTNAALYYYDFKDMQVTRAGGNITTGTVLAVTENAASAEAIGLDLDVIWVPMTHLTLTAGINISESEYKEYDATGRVFTSVVTGTDVPGMSSIYYDAKGKSLLRAPDFSGFATAQYDVPLANGAHLPINLNYSYKDAYNFDFVAHELSAPLRQKAYGLLNARISYVSAGDRWSVGVWGNNLTDKIYFDDVVGAGTGLRASYGDPRTYGVDFKVTF